MNRPSVPRFLAVSLLLWIAAMLTTVATAPAQSDADLERVGQALEKVKKATAELEESGFLSEARKLQEEVDRIRKTIQRMRAKRDPDRTFRKEVVIGARLTARSKLAMLHHQARARNEPPPPVEVRRFERMIRYLERYRVAWTDRFQYLQMEIAGAQNLRSEYERDLRRARQTGDQAYIDERERKLRCQQKYLERLEGDRKRIVWIKVSDVVADFIREMQKRQEPRERGKKRD
jgi:hypothetical protein